MAARGRRSDTRPARTRDEVLQQHLARLWRKVAARRSPPSLDRWLRRELGELNGLRRQERLMLGDMVADAIRFGVLIVFADTWAADTSVPLTNPEALADAWDAPTGPEIWEELRRLPVPVVFHWSFMRRRLDGTARPPVPAPDERSAKVWRLLREDAPRSRNLRLRCVWNGLPPGLTPRLERRAELSGWKRAELLDWLDHQAWRPPLWLRPRDPDRLDALAAELDAGGFRAEVHDGALALRGPRGIYDERCWKDGEVDIQDLASQMIGRAADVRTGQTVWDMCAGAGGKTLQLAAAAGPGGAVHATDIHQGRLRDLERRVKRAGLANVTVEHWDGTEAPESVAETIAGGGYPRVLVDAPCSGSGTWRRNPDGRLRDTDRAVTELNAVQRGLLERAAPAVAPGGLLIYATCSWLPEEDEAVTDAFLAAHPEFALRNRALAGLPLADADTTFAAVLARRTASAG